MMMIAINDGMALNGSVSVDFGEGFHHQHLDDEQGGRGHRVKVQGFWKPVRRRPSFQGKKEGISSRSPVTIAVRPIWVPAALFDAARDGGCAEQGSALNAAPKSIPAAESTTG